MLYLIHFEQKYHHARHYLGYTEDLEHRLEEHRSGKGSPLLKAVTEAGIEWSVVKTWPMGNRSLERKLKNRNHSPRLCPYCVGAETRCRQKARLTQ